MHQYLTFIVSNHNSQLSILNSHFSFNSQLQLSTLNFQLPTSPPLHAPIPYIHPSSILSYCRTSAAVRHRMDDIAVVYRLVVRMVSSHIHCTHSS